MTQYGISSAADVPSTVSTIGDAGDGPPAREQKSLSELKKMLDDYRFVTATARTSSLVDYDYYDGKQFTPTEIEVFRDRGQPDIYVNRTRVAINGILGVVAQSQTDPRAWPRNPEDTDASDVATDILRYAAELARFNREKVECAKDFLIGGTTAALISVDEDSNPLITQIRWEEFFIDPRSRRSDGKDARYMGIAKWMYIPDVQRMYPDQKDDLQNVTEGGSANIGATDESFQDRPVNQGWIDLRSKRAMVVEIYYQDDDGWCKAVFYYGGTLEQGPSPFKDHKGVPSNPIECQSCYVDRDNVRYGVVRDMRPLQDEINKRRAKLLHILNSSQIQAKDPSAVEVDANTARKEAARPDGVIPFGWEKVPMSDMAQGQMQLLAESKAEMERFGPNPAVLGRQGADTSGRALLARQQAGLVELAILLDQLQDWELRIYRGIWARVKQFWTAPMYIRVTDDQDAPAFVGLNQPIPNPQAGQPMVDQQTGQPSVDPVTQTPMIAPNTLGFKNNVAEMDVDIIIDTTAATATIQQEQFKDLMDLVGTNPLYAQQVPFTMFIEIMPGIPHKRRLIKQLTAYAQQQQQAQQQAQQKQEQLSEAQVMAKVKDMSSKGDLNAALATKAQGDTRATAARTDTQANKAMLESTIAHEETNIHRYEALAAVNDAKAERDAGGKAA